MARRAAEQGFAEARNEVLVERMPQARASRRMMPRLRSGHAAPPEQGLAIAQYEPWRHV